MDATSSLSSQCLKAATLLAAVKMTQTQEEVFGVLLRKSASATQIIDILGLPDVVNANAAVGQFGRKVLEHLGEHPDPGDPFSNTGNWNVVCTGVAGETGFVWSLRPEVRESLGTSGLAPHRGASG